MIKGWWNLYSSNAGHTYDAKFIIRQSLSYIILILFIIMYRPLEEFHIMSLLILLASYIAKYIAITVSKFMYLNKSTTLYIYS